MAERFKEDRSQEQKGGYAPRRKSSSRAPVPLLPCRDDWSREQKDEYSKKRMVEMELKNKKYKQRYAEVEADRKTAEAENSAMTSDLVPPNQKTEATKEEPKLRAKSEREWDQGKDLDQLDQDWSSPHYQPRQQSWRGGRDKRFAKKDHWRDRRSNKDSTSKYRESEESWGYRGATKCRNDTPKEQDKDDYSSAKQQAKEDKDIYNYESCRSFRNSKLNDTRKRGNVDEEFLNTQNPSDSELVPIKQSTKLESDRMWRDGGTNEVLQHRQNRVAKWVKSINSPCVDNDNLINPKMEDERYDKSIYEEEKCKKSEPGIFEEVEIPRHPLEKGFAHYYQYSCKGNPPQSAATSFPDENKIRKNNDYYKNSLQKASNRQWNNKSKYRSSSDYSGSYENQGFKQESSWKKPDNRSFKKSTYIDSKVKTGSRPSSFARRYIPNNPPADNCSHEIEYDESVLVKIESHTVKRTIFNSVCDTERETLPENKVLDNFGHETELTKDFNTAEFSENVQQNFVESSSWGERGLMDDCYFDNGNQNLGSCEENDYSAIVNQESFSQDVLSVDSETDNPNFDNYQIENEKLYSGKANNESEYKNVKGNQCKMVGEILPVEKDPESENNLDFNNESSLSHSFIGTPNADMQSFSDETPLFPFINMPAQHIEEICSFPKTDRDIEADVDCRNVSPEISGVTPKSLEDIKLTLNKSKASKEDEHVSGAESGPLSKEDAEGGHLSEEDDEHVPQAVAEHVPLAQAVDEHVHQAVDGHVTVEDGRNATKDEDGNILKEDDRTNEENENLSKKNEENVSEKEDRFVNRGEDITASKNDYDNLFKEEGEANASMENEKSGILPKKSKVPKEEGGNVETSKLEDNNFLGKLSEPPDNILHEKL